MHIFRSSLFVVILLVASAAVVGAATATALQLVRETNRPLGAADLPPQSFIVPPTPKWQPARMCSNDACVVEVLNSLTPRQAGDAKVVIAGPSIAWVFYWQ